MDFRFLFYIFLSIVSITGGSFYFFKAGMATTGAIYFFGLFVMAIVFGMRWFSASGDTKLTPSGTWPPMINYCPDFLTMYRENGGSTPICVDTIGVALPGGITKWDGNGTPSEAHTFELHTNLAGTDRIKALCDEVVAKKLTWEGVHDGRTCLNNEPPKPPKA